MCAGGLNGDGREKHNSTEVVGYVFSLANKRKSAHFYAATEEDEDEEPGA
jgi:hypothetical protein